MTTQDPPASGHLEVVREVGMSSVGREGAGAAESSQPGATAHQTEAIVYVGPRQAFSDHLIRDVRLEFPEFAFVSRDTIEQLIRFHEADNSTRLVIVEASIWPSFREASEELAEMFAEAVICMCFTSQRQLASCLDEVLRGGIVRGFLPMNLRLDIWLSAIRVMVNGGDYCSPDMVSRLLELNTGRAKEAADRRHSQSERTRQPTGVTKLSMLTPREMQVLQLVVEGLQNKNVAERLSLSEHTVKLHMHHIMSKLGAANRTEASGIFLKHFDGVLPDTPRPS